jgi:hypothetical protein
VFRNSVVLLSICVVAFALVPSATIAQDGHTVYCDPAHDTVCAVHQDEELVITNHWGACRRGLVTVFLKAIEVQEYVLTAADGAVVWSVDTEAAQDLWGPTEEFWGDALQLCIVQVSTGYISYWEHELGVSDLQPGDYTLHFTLSLRHPLIDGLDADGDGRPDQYSGQLQNTDVAIHILED